MELKADTYDTHYVDVASEFPADRKRDMERVIQVGN